MASVTWNLVRLEWMASAQSASDMHCEGVHIAWYHVILLSFVSSFSDPETRHASLITSYKLVHKLCRPEHRGLKHPHLALRTWCSFDRLLGRSTHHLHLQPLFLVDALAMLSAVPM